MYIYSYELESTIQQSLLLMANADGDGGGSESGKGAFTLEFQLTKELRYSHNLKKVNG